MVPNQDKSFLLLHRTPVARIHEFSCWGRFYLPDLCIGLIPKDGPLSYYGIEGLACPAQTAKRKVVNIISN